MESARRGVREMKRGLCSGIWRMRSLMGRGDGAAIVLLAEAFRAKDALLASVTQTLWLRECLLTLKRLRITKYAIDGH